METERWRQIKTLLHSALEREPSERSAFLAAACADDDLLRKEIESLITSHEQAGGFIESPAFEVMAESLTNNGTQSVAGQTLGHYKVIEQIGTGGMGEVYLAEDTRLGRKVALKLLPGYFTTDDERVRRFQQEARAASNLNHPNILTIYEIGEINSRHFIATEFIEGETLRHRLEKRQAKLSEALDIAVQMTSALSAAHRAGIAHRDIKPENIMLRTDGIVKVLDFGLAKLTEQKSAELETATLVKTREGIVMGSAHYMSPEQARGQKMDGRTDLFSLGVVLYEMLAGRPPFEGDTSSDIIVSILQKEPLPFVRFLPEAPKELQRIVTKALRKDVEDRYQTSRDLLVDLKSLKEELEFEAKLENSQSPDATGRAAALTSGDQATAGTRKDRATRTGDMAPAQVTSSAEYVINEIKRHKTVVAVIAAIVVLIIGGLVYSSFTGRDKTIDSLAVLPFLNASTDPSTEYLSDGITESIIYTTSRLPNLKVVPRSSVFRYKGREIDPQTVGHELGVSAVMTGRFIQHGNDLSISAELIDVRDNRLLWGQQYTRKITDILAVQEEIAREISEKLRLRLTIEERTQLAKRYPENAEAYQLYLKGRYYWYKRTRDGYRKAIEHFEQAIGKDPSYALAYTGLADSYSILSPYGIAPPKDTFPKAKAAAIKALELDSNLAEAHNSLAYVKYQFDWDWSGAESEFQRAIELNPNYATAHQWYAIHLAGMGRMNEAIREITRAQELDPLALIANVNAGWIFYHSRQYDRAIEEMRKSLDMDPNFARGHWAISEPLEQQQKYQEAIAELEKARQLDETPTMLALLGHIYALTGKRNEAQKIIGELREQSKQIYVDPYFLAQIHTALGDRDKAFQNLERAYEGHSSWLVWLKVEPKFDSLRSDPRFANLVHRIGLAP